MSSEAAERAFHTEKLTGDVTQLGLEDNNFLLEFFFKRNSDLQTGHGV